MSKGNTVVKKNILGSILGLSIISMSTIVSAEIERYGIGISATQDGSTIKAPLDLGNNLRVEPELSFSSFNPDVGDSRTDISLGSGVYLLEQVSDTVDLYYGGKALLGVANGGGNSNTTVSLAAIVGFEYFFDKQISVGGEVGFGLGLGDDTRIGTQTGVVLRYYTK